MTNEELRRLAMEATPGPLHHNKDNEQIGDVSNEAGYPFLQVMQQQPRDHKQRDADAAYVAAALNAVPALLADLERKDALLRRAGEVLKAEYAAEYDEALELAVLADIEKELK